LNTVENLESDEMNLNIALRSLWARRNLGAFMLACVVALTACNRKPPQAQRMTPEVSVYTVQEEPVVLTTELPGRTSPFRIAEVRPQVNGLIQKRLFTEGSDVKEGDPLYQIDPAPFKAALENAKAALARSEANLPAARVRVERYEKALAERAVSQQVYDDAAAALKQAEADVAFQRAMVETAQINLGYALVRSPISGRIGASSVTDGAIVTAYQPMALATIQQLDPIYVDVPQAATEALRLRAKLEKGVLSNEGKQFSEVELILPDGSKYPQKGMLQFRDVSVDPMTGTVTMRMVFPNSDKILLPGMFVSAIVTEGKTDRAILLPQQTVSRDPKGNAYALVVDDSGTVAMRMLTVERAIGPRWVISSGIQPGERVIAEGAQKARPGTVVKTVSFHENKPMPGGASGPAQTAGASKAPQQQDQKSAAK
jgi:membrane fusion protein (multidrug efflux system)